MPESYKWKACSCKQLAQLALEHSVSIQGPAIAAAVTSATAAKLAYDNRGQVARKLAPVHTAAKPALIAKKQPPPSR